MKLAFLLLVLASAPAAANDSRFHPFDVVNCSTSQGQLVGRIITLDSDTSAEIVWMDGEVSRGFNLKRSCANVTTWAAESVSEI